MGAYRLKGVLRRCRLSAALHDAALGIPPTALQLHVTPEAEAAQRSALLQSKSSSSRSARSSSISSDEVLRGIAQQLHAALSASSMQPLTAEEKKAAAAEAKALAERTVHSGSEQEESNGGHAAGCYCKDVHDKT
eukprot:4957-Heterococcus_DN1.PRE.2